MILTQLEGYSELGYIYRTLGSMSQLEYLYDRLPPSPPRSKPLKFYSSQQLPLHLDNPQNISPSKMHPPLTHESRARSKSSILSFLSLRPRQTKYLFQQSNL